MSLHPTTFNNKYSSEDFLSINGVDYANPDFTAGPPRLTVSGLNGSSHSANGIYNLSDKISNCSPVYHKAGEYKIFGADTSGDFSNFSNRYYFNDSNDFFGLSDELIRNTEQGLELKFNPSNSSRFFGLFSDLNSYQNRSVHHINFEDSSINLLLNVIPTNTSREYDVGLCIRQFDNYYIVLIDTITLNTEENIFISKPFNSLSIQNIFSNYEEGNPMKDLDLIKDGSSISEFGFFIKPKGDAEDTITLKIGSVVISNSFCDDYYISELNDSIVLSKSLEDPTSSSFIGSNQSFRQKFNPSSDGYLLSKDNLDFFYSGRPKKYTLDSRFGCSADFYGESARIISNFGDKKLIDSNSFNWDIDLDGELDADQDPLNILGTSTLRSFRLIHDLIPEEYKSFNLNIEGIDFESSENTQELSLTSLCFEINDMYSKTGIWSFFIGAEFILIRPKGGRPPLASLKASSLENAPKINIQQANSELSYSPTFYSNIRYVF